MASKPNLLEQMRLALRLRHMSLRTEKAYVNWARRFILFHNKRHPREMGAEEIRAFLSHLAVHEHVAASTRTSPSMRSSSYIDTSYTLNSQPSTTLNAPSDHAAYRPS